MRGQSFINFLREEDGKADRQKVLSISALVGSSVLAQLMFMGVTQAMHCSFTTTCTVDEKEACKALGCFFACSGAVASCYD